MRNKYFVLICLALICLTVIQPRPLQAGGGDGSAISFRIFTWLESEDTTFETDGALTLELWFRTTKTNGLQLLTHEDPGSSPNFVQLRVNPTSQTVRFVVADQAGNTAAVDSPTGLGDGLWHHAAGVRDGGTMQLYIDGLLVSETSDNLTTGDLNINGPVKIGRWRFGGGATLLEVDEARIWHTARTAAEIANNRYGGVPVDAAGLVGYWPMAAGSGTTVADATGGGNDLLFSDSGTSLPKWAGRAWAGGDSAFGSGLVGGVGVDASTFIADDGDDITLFSGVFDYGVSMANLPAGVMSRWAQYFLLSVTDAASPVRGGGSIDVTFDISDAGGTGDFDASETYSLLRRNGEIAGGNFIIVPTLGTVVNGDRVTFTVDPSNFSPTIQQITIGTNMDFTAVGMSGQPSASGGQPAGLVLLLALGLVVFSWVISAESRRFSDRLALTLYVENDEQAIE